MDINNHKELIEKYRKSDFGDRIFLFLEYRDLRPEFSAIDMADAKINRELATEKHRSSFSTHSWWYVLKRFSREIFSSRRPASDLKK